MIGTEFIKGQGLGNHLLSYVCARAVAKRNGCEFGTACQEQFAKNMHNSEGNLFFDIDLGIEITDEMKASMNRYDEKEVRLFLGNCNHDMINGCYVAGVDPVLASTAQAADTEKSGIEDNTLIYGNLQAEEYFKDYIDELKDWVRVKPKYDTHEYSRENLCIINIRGGEYANSQELFISRKYWLNAIKKMKSIREDMEFMIVTEDEAASHRVLPNIEAHHFDMITDYAIVKNAHYLICSNSSFAVVPVFTGENLKYAIAPKYWARFNTSDGYWASEQNIYSRFHYMDKRGQIYTPEECRKELEEYKKISKAYKKTEPATGILRVFQQIRNKAIKAGFWMHRIKWSLEKRLGLN